MPEGGAQSGCAPRRPLLRWLLPLVASAVLWACLGSPVAEPFPEATGPSFGAEQELLSPALPPAAQPTWSPTPPPAPPSEPLRAEETAPPPVADVGDPVPLYAEHELPLGRLSSKAEAVLELPCGAFLYGRNAHERLAPASLTKLVTALIAIEQPDMDTPDAVRVSASWLAATTRSTVMGLEPGMQPTLRDLLYGLLLPSGNDAAIAIAERIAGSVPAFTQLMNRKVEELGLRNTHFANPHGLDAPEHYTSAFDIAIIGKRFLEHEALASIVTAESYLHRWGRPLLRNNNQFLRLYPGAMGVKIGYTRAAGQTIVAAAERDGRRLLVAVLGSTNRYADAIALFDWAFTNTPPACPPE